MGREGKGREGRRGEGRERKGGTPQGLVNTPMFEILKMPCSRATLLSEPTTR